MTPLWTLETAGASAEILGSARGLAPRDLEEAAPRAERAVRALSDAREAGRAGFVDLPLRGDIALACAKEADRVAGLADTLVVVGMGGSALGARALVAALGHPFQRSVPRERRGGRPRVVVLDTADPSAIVPALEAFPPHETAWNFVSKTGGTLETQAVYGVVRERLRKDLGPAWRERVVMTTDPALGPFHEEAVRERLAVLEIPAAAGGRYSALSAAGLFPAAVAGADPRAILSGAAAASAAFVSAEPARNDALRLALTLVLLAERHGCREHALVPYRHGMFDLALWWQQLWSESLGKDGKGYGAVAAVGSAAQHSLLQLWSEGPAERAQVFVEIDDAGEDLVLPAAGPPGAPWLGERSLGDVHAALAAGTRVSLAERGRPTIGIRLPACRPDTVGALLQLLMTSTALAGPLSGVDPFGQPGVEAGKAHAGALLGREDVREGRAGAADLRDRLRARR
jgi:glucose-6-phosphate isomerase